MSSRIVIGSRSSALARLQAYHVSAELKRMTPDLEVELYFKESMGDKDLVTPLWQMGDRGVFTRDLTEDLLAGRVDAVIHSYKDLEIEPDSRTQILSVLSRADTRDLLLIKKESLPSIKDSTLLIYSSSPRRQYNLTKFLARALPQDNRPAQIEFDSIRGNIQTRLRKFMEMYGQGFVIAKAALDRILSEDFEESNQDEYKTIREQIKLVLKKCNLMIIPLSRNPCAPAQGAFAMEFRADDDRLREMAKELNHGDSEKSVNREREILSGYGGGCHQKIGASYVSVAKQSITFVQGETDAGQVLDQVRIESAGQVKEIQVDQWPSQNWVVPVSTSPNWKPSVKFPGTCEFIVKKGSQEPSNLCTKTVADWFDLANNGIWVNSSADALGWDHAPDMTLLC